MSRSPMRRQFSTATQECAAPPIGSALSASCINRSKRVGSVGSFVGLLVKEVKKFDCFVAQKIASDLYRTAAKFLHARARDGQLVEARALRILNVRAIDNFGNSRPVAR